MQSLWLRCLTSSQQLWLLHMWLPDSFQRRPGWVHRDRPQPWPVHQAVSVSTSAYHHHVSHCNDHTRCRNFCIRYYMNYILKFETSVHLSRCTTCTLDECKLKCIQSMKFMSPRTSACMNFFIWHHGLKSTWKGLGLKNPTGFRLLTQINPKWTAGPPSTLRTWVL